jgi:hypothetical protein
LSALEHLHGFNVIYRYVSWLVCGAGVCG